jgi:1-acyl-sn-glycerol-3-phosphate acyltransferase
LTGTAEPDSSKLRIAARVTALVLLFLACLPPHLIAKRGGRRSPWPRRFLGAAARIIGARITTSGAAIEPHSLLVSNHVTWLDILILGSATGCAFVSKDEVRTARMMGWLADQNRTLYIRRAERRNAHEQAAAVEAALRDPQPLTLFPEGTTGDGGTLLPFRSTLLEAVAPPPPGVVVRPVAVDYGAATRIFGWPRPELGKTNALRILGHRGTTPVTVRLLDPLPPSDDRKVIARAAHDAIAAALAAAVHNNNAAALAASIQARPIL